MGYLKSGSQKSLGAGGASALLLFFVYSQLPVRPAFASSVGLGNERGTNLYRDFFFCELPSERWGSDKW